MRTVYDNASKFLRLLSQRRSRDPQEIQIEVTNACNLKCEMCPHTQGTVPQQDFPFALFKDMVKHNPAPRRLVLTGWGEPLLHPQFFDLIGLANQYWPQTLVRFTTNGILLDEGRRRFIKEHRIAGVTVSLDLWPERKDIPRHWRDILHPPTPKVLRNLRDYGADQPLVKDTPLILQSLLVEENFDDIKQLIEFASEHSINAINLVRMQSYPGYPVQRPDWMHEQEMIGELIRYGKRHKVKVRSVNHQTIALQLATHHDRVCMRTDDSIYITVDGGITPCCNLRTYTIGNLNSDSLHTAWHSEKEQTFFADQSPICGSCDALFYKHR